MQSTTSSSRSKRVQSTTTMFWAISAIGENAKIKRKLRISRITMRKCRKWGMRTLGMQKNTTSSQPSQMEMQICFRTSGSLDPISTSTPAGSKTDHDSYIAVSHPYSIRLLCPISPFFDRFLSIEDGNGNANDIIITLLQMPPGRKEQEPYDYMVKVVIIGDSAVGKTNILLRFTNNEYKMAHITTIGVDFKIKIISIDGVKLKMQIWDTAGQERFKTITETYYKGASGVILVYAVNDRKTFNNIENWLKQINENQPENISKLLVANKADLPESERQVSKSEGEALAKKFGIKFIESSAKDDMNVGELFHMIGKQMKEALKETETPSTNNNGVKIKGGNQNQTDEKKKNCEC